MQSYTIHLNCRRIKIIVPQSEDPFRYFKLPNPENQVQLPLILYNIFLLKTHRMQDLPQMNQMMTIFYPIWIETSARGEQRQYLQPMGFYPSFFQPVINHLPIQNLSPQNQNKEKGSDSVKPVQKQKDKIESKGVQEMKELQPQIDCNQESKKQKIQKEPTVMKIKRPITYETEKSYYMKQKIKGKMKCNYRILRKRTSGGSSTSIKSKLRATSLKVSVKEQKDVKKKHKIEKTESKVNKIAKRIKIKPLREPWVYLAEVPSLIQGAKELNQFLSAKIRNLQLRQIHKK